MTRWINQHRRGLLAVAAATIAGMELAMFGSQKSVLGGIGADVAGPLAALRHATTWLNSPPLTEGGLRGKTVLVDFCTYTCINWLRQLPYLRSWAERYRAHGLVVTGVPTPEFGFESDLDNVRRAVRQLRVDYQVEGKPPLTLEAGDVLFIPAGTIHAAKNVGRGNAAELATYIVEKGKPLVVLLP